MAHAQQIFCPIRKLWTAALPEELVRQRMIRYMIEERGYPAELLSVEKALRELLFQRQSHAMVPDRRVDLAVFCSQKGIIFPLLLMECKAVPIGERTMRQLAGYNHFVGAPFISLVNQSEIRTGWFDPAASSYRYLPYLPTYQELLSSLCCET